jgi:hypothetical protein
MLAGEESARGGAETFLSPVALGVAELERFVGLVDEEDVEGSVPHLLLSVHVVCHLMVVLMLRRGCWGVGAEA